MRGNFLERNAIVFSSAVFLASSNLAGAESLENKVNTQIAGKTTKKSDKIIKKFKKYLEEGPGKESRNSIGRGGKCPTPQKFYHSRGKLSNGACYVVLGACTYLLDSRGARASTCYHEITPFKNGPVSYRAKVGSGVYLLDKKGRALSNGYHKITPFRGGYRTELGTQVCFLNRYGKVRSCNFSF